MIENLRIFYKGWMSMYHLYRMVPPCSRCGSWNTGYYIKGNVSERWIIKWALKRGEIVLIDSAPEHNCFCGHCGIEWTQDIPLKLLSQSEWEEQKKLREIDKAYENAMEIFDNDERKVKEEKRNKKWYVKTCKKVKDKLVPH